MAFSGGGSNILKPHTHDSTILQDGGNLNFDNITQSDMAAGSVTYSNGSHLQELVKPVTPANQMLIFATAATTPSWATDPFIAAGKLEYLGVHTSVAEEETFTFTFPSPIDWDDFAAIQVYYSYDMDGPATVFNTELILDGSTGTYHSFGQTQSGTTITGFQTLGATSWIIADTNINSGNSNNIYGMFTILSNDIAGTYYPAITSNAWGSSYANRTFNGVKHTNLGTIATVTFTSSAGAGSGWENGKFLFYGVRR